MRQREIIAIEKRKAKKKAKLLKEKEKKKAKERKKKERKKEKLRKKRELVRKRKIRIYKKRVYKEKKAEKLKALKEKGDRLGRFRIIITENGDRIETLSKPKTLLAAFEEYNNIISENRKNVIGYKRFKRVGKINSCEVITLDYEILIVENVSKPENVYTTSFREEGGKYIESKVVDSDKHVILAKDKWLVPELYSVYGFNPNDKKTGKWVYDNIILKNLSKTNTKMVSQFKQRVLVQDGNDLDLVTCKYVEEAEILYKCIEEYGKNEKNLTFLKKIPTALSQRFNKKVIDKTGWNKRMLSVAKHVVIQPLEEYRNVSQA